MISILKYSVLLLTVLISSCGITPISEVKTFRTDESIQKTMASNSQSRTISMFFATNFDYAVQVILTMIIFPDGTVEILSAKATPPMSPELKVKLKKLVSKIDFGVSEHATTKVPYTFRFFPDENMMPESLREKIEQ